MATANTKIVLDLGGNRSAWIRHATLFTRSWARRTVSLGASALMLAGLGCNDAQKGTPRLSPRSTIYLENVPIPAGFTLEDSNSEDSSSGAQRWARHWYRGDAEVQAVRRFYLEQMPDEGWSVVSDQNVKGVVNLRFERKGEACTIQIQPHWMPFRQCRIQVVVMPYDRKGAEPPSRRAPAPMAP